MGQVRISSNFGRNRSDRGHHYCHHHSQEISSSRRSVMSLCRSIMCGVCVLLFTPFFLAERVKYAVRLSFVPRALHRYPYFFHVQVTDVPYIKSHSYCESNTGSYDGPQRTKVTPWFVNRGSSMSVMSGRERGPTSEEESRRHWKHRVSAGNTRTMG